MDMKIKAIWVISYTSGWAEFDLETMNCQSEEEWNALTEKEREEKIQEAIDDMCDAPSMILDKYNVE